MSSLAVLEKLGVSMETLTALRFFTFVQLGLCMSSVVLASVAAGGEGAVAKPALEWPLPRMHPFMNLEIRFVQELFSAYVFIWT